MTDLAADLRLPLPAGYGRGIGGDPVAAVGLSRGLRRSALDDRLGPA